MRIPERDVTYIVLPVFLLTPIDRYHWTGNIPIMHKIDHTQVNLIQLKTIELELDFAEYIQHTMCWLWTFAGLPIYHLPSNVIYATVALSTWTYSPSMRFPARLISDNSRSMKDFNCGHCSPQPPLRNQFLHGVWVLVNSYLRVRFELFSSINFRDVFGCELPSVLLVKRYDKFTEKLACTSG